MRVLSRTAFTADLFADKEKLLTCNAISEMEQECVFDSPALAGVDVYSDRNYLY